LINLGTAGKQDAAPVRDHERDLTCFHKATMNEIGSSEKGLQAVHKQWALSATMRLRFIHPELTVILYRKDWYFTLHVANCDDSAFPALVEYFDHSVRPITCNIRLSQQIPTVGAPIEEVDDYEAELWLNGKPLSTQDFNSLMSLSEPNLPDGGIDFDNNQNTWVFRSFTSLTDGEKACVRRATTRVGIIGEVDFVEVSPTVAPPQIPFSTPKRQGDLNLITSRHLKRAPDTLRDLVHQDEDEWRGFLSRRAKQKIVAPDSATTSNFACLYDVEHCGDSRLSELLTIYDRVDIMPERHSFEWSSKHQIPLPDLQELVRLKRVRIILPYSVADYPSTLLEAVVEVDRSSIVLSRALAAKTIEHGQMKEPFLYAPLTSGQRAAVLSAMSQSVTDEKHLGLLSSYGQMFSGQHDMFMMRGALASLGFGVGAYLGDVFLKLGNKDARIELMTCGAGIEWALGLGASYIPRDYGGFDETWNSQIIASYLGRTRLHPSDPIANRMHIISDGLLAVSGVPPLEVARNFHSLPASRFRNLARRLMEGTPNASELQNAVDQINADVKHFERRAERLASWKMNVLLSGAILTTVEHDWPATASVGAAWLYAMLEHKIPVKLRDELADARAMLTGLATGSSLDAVVVSRSRKVIAKNKNL
jgi:hypothetical protein